MIKNFWIPVLGEDRKIHEAKPEDDKTLCGINIIKKFVTNQDYDKYYHCPECDTRLDLLFAETEEVGTLYYSHIYTTYDGQPLIFVTTNNFGEKFFCYSISDEVFLVQKVNTLLLSKMDDKTIDLRSILMRKDIGTLQLSFRKDLYIKEDWIYVQKSGYTMPEKGVFLGEPIFVYD